MALCLLVYNLGQRQLRQALAGQEQTIPNQLGKPTHLLQLSEGSFSVLWQFISSFFKEFSKFLLSGEILSEN